MLTTGSIYCENFSNIFLLAEPLNSITNISFFVAGFILLSLYKKRRLRDTYLLSLIILVFSVGIGSSVWHLTQSLVGEILDEIPILLFLLVYVILFLRRVIRWRWYYVLLSTISFLIASFLAPNIWKDEPLRTSGGYLPALVVLIVFTVLAFKRDRKLFKHLFLAATLFIASIIFRSLDFIVCGFFPLGVHFVWHILNGMVLFYVTRGLMYYGSDI